MKLTSISYYLLLFFILVFTVRLVYAESGLPDLASDIIKSSDSDKASADAVILEHAVAQNDGESVNRIREILDFISQHTEDAGAVVVWKTLQDRTDFISTLIEGASANNSIVRARSMYLLGIYRAEEAVEVLTKEIDFNYADQTGSFSKRVWASYPAFNALWRIGMPSIPAMIDLLKNEDDYRRRGFALLVIREVLPDSMASSYLQIKMDQIDNHKAKEKLEKALQQSIEWDKRIEQGDSVGIWMLYEETEVSQ